MHSLERPSKKRMVHSLPAMPVIKLGVSKIKVRVCENTLTSFTDTVTHIVSIGVLSMLFLKDKTIYYQNSTNMLRHRLHITFMRFQGLFFTLVLNHFVFKSKYIILKSD